MAASLAVAAPPVAALEAPCTEATVLTLLGTDTAADRSLFAVSSSDPGGEYRVLLFDGAVGRGRLLDDSLSGLRTGASHGRGPFLSALRCGEECFQPLQWAGLGWQRIGEPISERGGAALHMTWDRGGAPWVLFHRLSELSGVTDVTAYRWDGELWRGSGQLRVQAVGSPAAAADPAFDDAVLSGSGRFRAGRSAAYWLPSLPRSDGGQVFAIVGAAVFLSNDGRLLMSVDGGSTWLPDEWTPWGRVTDGSPGWQRGVDYSLDRPTTAMIDHLPILWFDDRSTSEPRLHLTHWSARTGWRAGPTIELAGSDSRAVDHALVTEQGHWTLLGSCHGAVDSAYLEAIIAGPEAAGARNVEIPISAELD